MKITPELVLVGPVGPGVPKVEVGLESVELSPGERGALKAGDVVIGAGAVIGAGPGETPMPPVLAGPPMIVPGVPEPGVVAPAAPPEETPEGVDTAPPTGWPAVGAAEGPLLP